MRMQILPVKGEKELQKLYRFRYKVYIEELGRTQQWADHERKEIREPLDEHSDNFVAYRGEKIIGCLRCSSSNQNLESKYNDFYDLSLFEDFYPDNISFVTKLIIAPEQRNGLVGIRLATAGFKHLSELGCFCFIDCYERMIPFFLKLGYLFYTEKKWHPEFGEVQPMVLKLKDGEYLRKINSPFLKYPAKNTDRKQESIQFFDEKFQQVHNNMYKEYAGSNVF